MQKFFLGIFIYINLVGCGINDLSNSKNTLQEEINFDEQCDIRNINNKVKIHVVGETHTDISVLNGTDEEEKKFFYSYQYLLKKAKISQIYLGLEGTKSFLLTDKQRNSLYQISGIEVNDDATIFGLEESKSHSHVMMLLDLIRVHTSLANNDNELASYYIESFFEYLSRTPFESRKAFFEEMAKSSANSNIYSIILKIESLERDELLSYFEEVDFSKNSVDFIRAIDEQMHYIYKDLSEIYKNDLKAFELLKKLQQKYNSSSLEIKGEMIIDLNLIIRDRVFARHGSIIACNASKTNKETFLIIGDLHVAGVSDYLSKIPNLIVESYNDLDFYNKYVKSEK